MTVRNSRASAPAAGGPAGPAAPPPLSGPVASGLRPNGYTVASHLDGIPARTGRTGADGLVHRTSPGGGHPRPRPQRRPREQESPDGPLIEVATSIVAQARLRGDGLSQAALARQLRAEGYRIANDRLRWLATVSGLDAETGRT
jgi:hypothetical protein